MAGQRLEHIEACVFDAYGTLFDFNSAVGRCQGEIGEKADAPDAEVVSFSEIPELLSL